MQDEPALFASFSAGTPHRPFVVGQLGQSLDGRIATRTGDSKYINGPATLDHLHAIRARVDAVLVGAGTVVADDPLLTVRRVTGRSPARIVLDPNGRVDPGAQVFGADGARRIVIRRPANSAGLPDGVERLDLGGETGPIEPTAIVAALGRLGFARILVEGGAQTVSHFLASGCLDRLHVMVSPILIGSGLPGLTLPPIDRLGDALRPSVAAYVMAGGDVLFDCDLRRPAVADAVPDPEAMP